MNTLQKFVYLSFSVFTAGVVHADEMLSSECVYSLMSALEGPSDISSCPIMRQENGNIVGLTSDEGAFFVSPDGEGTIYYWINTKINSVIIKKSKQEPDRYPINGWVNFPDGKFFYYPFFAHLDAKERSERPANMKRICPDPKLFSLTGNKRCGE